MLRLQGNRLGITRMKAAQAAELCSLAHTLPPQEQEDVITEKRLFEPFSRGREAGRPCAGFSHTSPAQAQTLLACTGMNIFGQGTALP